MPFVAVSSFSRLSVPPSRSRSIFFKTQIFLWGDISPFEDPIELWRTEEGETVLNPVAVGLPFQAEEVPELRTEKTATFDLGDGRFAATSNTSPIFTHEDTGVLVPIADEGTRDGGSYVFRHLPEDVRVRFDLTHPSVRLWQRGKGSFVIRFRANATGVIESEDSVTYQLNPSTLLRWRIEHNRIKQEIWISDHANKADLAFSITPEAGLTLERNGNDFSVTDQQHNVLFTLPGPVLLNGERKLIEKSIGISETNRFFDFSYSEEGLPETYIIDPSAGPNSLGTIEDDDTYGTYAWTDPGNASVSDNMYAVSESFNGQFSHYLKTTNFGFAVASNATINGVIFECERHRPSYNMTDYSIRLVKSGSVQGDDKSNFDYWESSEDVYYSYGGAVDLWSLTLVPGDVNASTFGVALSVAPDGATQDAIIGYVDHMRLTVYYTAGATPTKKNHQFLFID